MENGFPGLSFAAVYCRLTVRLSVLRGCAHLADIRNRDQDRIQNQ